MIEISTLEELRAIRRRLSEECGDDPARYAAMLAEFGQTRSGPHIAQPLAESASAIPSHAPEPGSQDVGCGRQASDPG